MCGSSASGGLRAASGPAPPARGTRGRRTGWGRLAPPPVGPPPSRPRPKHTSQSPEVVIFFRSPCRRHVGSRARPRDASGSVSRELPVLAGPGWQSGCAGWRIPGFRGPGTCNSFFQQASCQGGAGARALVAGSLACARRHGDGDGCAVLTGRRGAALLPPPGARHLPKAAPPAAAPRLLPPLPWFQTVSAQLPFP